MAAPSTLAEQTKREKLVHSSAVPQSQAERIDLIRDGIKIAATIEEQAKAIACIRKHPHDLTIGFSDSLYSVLNFACGGSSVLHEILLQQAEQQRRDLEGANPTPLEKILINRIIACEFEVAEYQRTYFTKLKEGMSLPLCDSMQKRLDRAHNRHLAAIKALAQVRKLQIPTVAVAMPGSTQINMGERQINLAQGGASQINLEASGTPSTSAAPV